MDADLRVVMSLVLLVLAVLQLPLLLGRVPPNRFYGLRTRRSLRPDVWYPANAFAARAMLAACGLALIVIWTTPSQWTPEWFPAAVLTAAVLAALVASLVHLRRYR